MIDRDFQETVTFRSTSLRAALKPRSAAARLSVDELTNRLLGLLGLCVVSGFALLSIIAAFGG